MARFRALQGSRDAAAKDRALLCRSHEAGGCGRKDVQRLPKGLHMLLLPKGVALRSGLLLKAPGLLKGVGGGLMTRLLSLTEGDAPVAPGLGPKPCARLGPKAQGLLGRRAQRPRRGWLLSSVRILGLKNRGAHGGGLLTAGQQGLQQQSSGLK